jgi:hypothetical protein
MALPIFDSSNGRTIIGYAAGERSAGVAIRRMVNVPKDHCLVVWRRNRDMQDMLDLPDGYVYSIYYSPSA